MTPLLPTFKTFILLDLSEASAGPRVRNAAASISHHPKNLLVQQCSCCSKSLGSEHSISLRKLHLKSQGDAMSSHVASGEGSGPSIAHGPVIKDCPWWHGRPQELVLDSAMKSDVIPDSAASSAFCQSGMGDTRPAELSVSTSLEVALGTVVRHLGLMVKSPASQRGVENSSKVADPSLPFPTPKRREELSLPVLDDGVMSPRGSHRPVRTSFNQRPDMLSGTTGVDQLAVCGILKFCD